MCDSDRAGTGPEIRRAVAGPRPVTGLPVGVGPRLPGPGGAAAAAGPLALAAASESEAPSQVSSSSSESPLAVTVRVSGFSTQLGPMTYHAMPTVTTQVTARAGSGPSCMIVSVLSSPSGKSVS
jgi:hypothetical protein